MLKAKPKVKQAFRLNVLALKHQFLTHLSKEGSNHKTWEWRKGRTTQHTTKHASEGALVDWRGCRDVERTLSLGLQHEVMDCVDIVVHGDPREALSPTFDWATSPHFSGKELLAEKTTCGRGHKPGAKVNQANTGFFNRRRSVFPIVGQITEEPFATRGGLVQYFVASASIDADGRARKEDLGGPLSSGQCFRKMARRAGSTVTNEGLSCLGPALVTDARASKMNHGVKILE